MGAFNKTYWLLAISLVLALGGCAQYEYRSNVEVIPMKVDDDFRQSTLLFDVGINAFGSKIK